MAMARAKKPDSLLQIRNRLLKFGEKYDVQKEADFLECVSNYMDEVNLIRRMMEQIDEDGLTVTKSYKSGDQPVAHPLIPEVAKHRDCAGRMLGVIREIVETRGAKKEETSDLKAFRIG